jgi:hypothetical protein
MSRWSCALLLLLSCGGGQAKHPDHGQVAKAQQAWCGMLAEADGEELASWRHREACQEAFPTASAVFLQRLTKCYREALERYGDNAPDSGAIIDTCSHDVLGAADPGDVSQTELYQARCSRQERCQKVSPDVCDGAWARLDGMTQSLLSAKYNRHGQSEIAACLNDKPCEEDDAAVEAACYDAAHGKLVWLPLSLGHDASLGPKVD